MSIEAQAMPPTVDRKPHAAFFRQSGWLMIANLASGGLTCGVHFLAKFVPEAQYAVFGTLLMVVACLPALPLQMIFAQQTALALATRREKQLAGLIRAGWFWLTLIWLAGAVAVFFFQRQIIAGWQLPNAIGLWAMVVAVLVSLWFPMFTGVMQGRQDFFGMGWSAILNGGGRVMAAAVLVLALAAGAGGMMIGTCIGISAATALVGWRSRDLWRLPGEGVDHKTLLKQGVPLLLGFGACQFMFTSDTIFAKAYFTGEEMAPYVAAGTLARALLWLVLPLAAVMFPKLVHANAKSEKNNLFGLVVLGTAGLTLLGGIGLWLTGPLVVKIVFKNSYILATTALLPWYAAAMVPLALANVLVNDLLARNRFGVVPWMGLLAIGYGCTLPWVLHHFHRLEAVLQTLGLFNLLLFGMCAVFAWGIKPKTAAAAN
jgi:O-antigen/teichoic acid export membrane protein